MQLSPPFFLHFLSLPLSLSSSLPLPLPLLSSPFPRQMRADSGVAAGEASPPAALTRMREHKMAVLRQIHRALCIHLGTPPSTTASFKWRYTNASKKHAVCPEEHTPVSFAKTLLPDVRYCNTHTWRSIFLLAYPIILSVPTRRDATFPSWTLFTSPPSPLTPMSPPVAPIPLASFS